MSHKSTEFELVKGVNVLTGPNNSGKSAVISALQLLAELPVKEGDYMVRHGTAESSVTVETDEGDVLAWRRKGSAMSLTINGDRDIRLQNNRDHYLEKLHKHLRLPKVSGNESKQDFDIHFANQKDPIFLINEPPSRAALFFASSSDAGRLFEVRDKFKDLVKAKRKEQQSAKTTLEQQQRILAKLAPLDEIEEQMKFVQVTFKQYPKDQEALRLSTKMLQDLKIYVRQFNSITSKHQVVRELILPPELEDSDKLFQYCKALKLEVGRLSIFSNKQKALAQLEQPPELLPTNDLAKQLHDLRFAEKKGLKLEKMQATLANLNVQPEIDNTERLTCLLKALHKDSVIVARLNSQQTHYESVNSPPLLEQESNLATNLRTLHETLTRHRSLEAHVKNLLQLNNIPDFDDLPRIEQNYHLLKKLSYKRSFVFRFHRELSELQPPPQINCTFELQELLSQLKSLKKRHTAHSQRVKLGDISQIPPQPEFEEIELLEKHFKDLYLHIENVQKLKAHLQNADFELRQWVNQHPSCPTCGGDLTIQKLQGSICNGS
ncbi:MAG: AAA family ATPase [Parachlamydiaceae bacterium]|nr:AAA family ATPase [Parachlamydiaceae bacterium]